MCESEREREVYQGELAERQTNTHLTKGSALGSAGKTDMVHGVVKLLYISKPTHFFLLIFFLVSVQVIQIILFVRTRGPSHLTILNAYRVLGWLSCPKSKEIKIMFYLTRRKNERRKR